ncbi:hypothetical protein [Thermobispora bispora]|uniref:hypothetical protein n=1 Tax=Thermobispora bispora TaxID=2006 RepID=UPI0002DFD153|nr:hypothetical protein [Thermobispora bispora]QSI46430.1 hypothetical protein CYL17_00045 [Thermobispora bispora]QSI49536.1 hypothetical protein CYL17_18110 [Thermobispora bispora]
MALLAALAAVCALAAGAPASAAAHPAVRPAERHAPALAAAAEGRERLVFRFRDPRIRESSGLAASPTHKGIVYTINDSGDGPHVYAVGMDGRTRATFTIAGATARDWEAIAASVDPATGRGVLWIGDIGDNLGTWPDISVYRVAEPRSLRDATLRATRYRLRYPDRPRDAEGLMVHPRTGRLYIVSKEFSGSVYAAPARLRTDRVNVLRRVGPAPMMATDAAYAPDGSSFVIRTYFSASLYRAPGRLITRLTMPPLDQAESITYTRDGKALLTGSEGAHSPVYRVPLPASARPKATASPTPSALRRTARPTASARQGGGGGAPRWALLLWGGLAAGAAGLLGLIVYRLRH